MPCSWLHHVDSSDVVIIVADALVLVMIAWTMNIKQLFDIQSHALESRSITLWRPNHLLHLLQPTTTSHGLSSHHLQMREQQQCCASSFGWSVCLLAVERWVWSRSGFKATTRNLTCGTWTARRRRWQSSLRHPHIKQTSQHWSRYWASICTCMSDLSLLINAWLNLASMHDKPGISRQSGLKLERCVISADNAATPTALLRSRKYGKHNILQCLDTPYSRFKQPADTHMLTQACLQTCFDCKQNKSVRLSCQHWPASLLWTRGT